jgi:L-ascorbate metabolism protein UlaG (beta-lactamase superfamily)
MDMLLVPVAVYTVHPWKMAFGAMLRTAEISKPRTVA